MASDKAVRLFYPLSRKTIDTYTVIRHYYPNITIRINVSNKLESILARLVYRKAVFDNGKEGIVLPQEVDLVLSSKLNCIWPGRQMVKNLNRKDDFYLLCRSANILVPRTWNNNFILNEQKKLIFKPRIGSGGKGIYIKEFHKGKILVPKDYICQEYLGNDNKIYGFFAFAKNGQVHSSYCHQRIETYPKKGGVTILSKKHENEDLLKVGYDVVNKLNYTGLLMIEFKYYQNQFYVIEINPRLWGSVLFCLSNRDNPITSYLSQFGFDKPKTCKRTDREFLVWLFPYGLFRLSVYRHLSKALLVNYPYDELRSNYLIRVLITIVFKIIR